MKITFDTGLDYCSAYVLNILAWLLLNHILTKNYQVQLKDRCLKHR